jgi:hypothetical protein
MLAKRRPLAQGHYHPIPLANFLQETRAVVKQLDLRREEAGHATDGHQQIAVAGLVLAPVMSIPH